MPASRIALIVLAVSLVAGSLPARSQTPVLVAKHDKSDKHGGDGGDWVRDPHDPHGPRSPHSPKSPHSAKSPDSRRGGSCCDDEARLRAELDRAQAENQRLRDELARCKRR